MASRKSLSQGSVGNRSHPFRFDTDHGGPPPTFTLVSDVFGSLMNDRSYVLRRSTRLSSVFPHGIRNGRPSTLGYAPYSSVSGAHGFSYKPSMSSLPPGRHYLPSISGFSHKQSMVRKQKPLEYAAIPNKNGCAVRCGGREGRVMNYNL